MDVRARRALRRAAVDRAPSHLGLPCSSSRSPATSPREASVAPDLCGTDTTVRAKMLSGEVLAEVRVASASTVSDTKRALQAASRVHALQQRLLLRGAEPEDRQTLAELGLAGQTVELQVVRQPPAISNQGSRLHGTGRCRPCARYWSPQGCPNLESCMMCHLCGPAKLPSCVGKIGTSRCVPCSKCSARLDATEVRRPERPATFSIPDLAHRRLERDVKALREQGLADLCDAGPCGSRTLRWWASIKGPQGSPYEGGTFFLDLDFPVSYPFDPPSVHFRQPVYHCNVNDGGGVCLDILYELWCPSLTLATVLLSLISLLGECNPEDALRPAIAEEFISDRERHDEIARQMVAKYATSPGSETKPASDPP